MTLGRDPLSACAAELVRVAGRVVELLAPGRQAGFHVDRIVMRARRTGELLNETSPNAAGAVEQTGLIAIDLMAGMTFAALWSGRARALATSDVGQRAATVMQLNNDLTARLDQAPIDLPAARIKAAAVLSAAENLRTAAYAFEERHRGGDGGAGGQPGDSRNPRAARCSPQGRAADAPGEKRIGMVRQARSS